MSKQDLLTFFYTNGTNLAVGSIIMILLTALAMAAIIYGTYYFTYRGVSYNKKFNGSLVLMLLISTVIMMMIASNIVISLGMVGALSIVRFRSAIKDSRDTVFIFWAITQGLCVGSQSFRLAWCSVLFIALVMLAVAWGPKVWHKYLLVVTGGKKPIDTVKLLSALDNYANWYKIRTVNEDEKSQEMIIEVVLKGAIDPQMAKILRKTPGVTSVNLVMETSETVG